MNENTSQERVEIIFPVGKNSPYLESSIVSLLEQSHPNWFLLAILDFDDFQNLKLLTTALPKSHFKIIYSPVKTSLSTKMNLAINDSEARYVARFDADDICHQERLSRQISFLSNEVNRDIAGVGTLAELIDNRSRIIGTFGKPLSTDKIRRAIIKRNQLIHPSMMFRGELLRSYRYNPMLSLGEDYELWLRMAREHSFAILPERLIQYRIHETNHSRRKFTKSEVEIVSAARRELAREMGSNNISLRMIELLWEFKNLHLGSLNLFNNNPSIRRKIQSMKRLASRVHFPYRVASNKNSCGQ